MWALKSGNALLGDLIAAVTGNALAGLLQKETKTVDLVSVLAGDRANWGSVSEVLVLWALLVYDCKTNKIVNHGLKYQSFL